MALKERALSVAMTFMEEFTAKGFEKLVFAVKEDLRRDENRVGHGKEEMEYFQIISHCLRYHRYKVMDEALYPPHENTAWTSPISTALASLSPLDPPLPSPSLPSSQQQQRVWEPNLRCMMMALDKMSFMRAITAIKRLWTIEKKHSLVWIPMETYKEMLCYVHLMLQSSNIAHHELAVAALYPLFYTNPIDALDPLRTLLHEWKPSYYSRKHAHLLIELVHETLKT